jgi:RimJ/RimL family protein N-acetyltransferase
MENAKRAMPYRVESERLVLLKEAVDSSLDHLRPWMPWAVYEPQSVEAKADRLRVFRGEFDLDRDYVYGILSRDERLAIGSSGLHTRLDAGGLEIGYWIRASHVGRGLATETASALVKVAFEIAKVERVEIHCRPDNVASAAVPRNGAPHDSMVWTLLAREYPESPASKTALAAYDVIGQRLL